MAFLSETPVRPDPVMSRNFIITLLDRSREAVGKSLVLSLAFDVALGGFSECSGLEMSMEPEEYKEGGNNGRVLQFANRVKWSNIILKKGIGAGSALWDWQYGFVEGKGKRRDGMIALLTDLKLPTRIWYFRKGLPVKYSGPTMNAAENLVAIEEIHIAHEGIYQVPAAGYVTAGIGIASTVGVKIATGQRR